MEAPPAPPMTLKERIAMHNKHRQSGGKPAPPAATDTENDVSGSKVAALRAGLASTLAPTLGRPSVTEVSSADLDSLAASARPPPPRSTRISAVNAAAAAAAAAVSEVDPTVATQTGEVDSSGSPCIAPLPRLVPVVLSSLRSIAGVGMPSVATPDPVAPATPSIELRIPPGSLPSPLGLHLWKPDAAAPARVLAVDPAGPAAAAGVLPGDELRGLESGPAQGVDVALCSEGELQACVRGALACAAGAVLRFGRPAPAA